MSLPAGSVVTPEAVVLEFRTAGLATRSIAKLVDIAALGLLFIVSLLLISAIGPNGDAAIIMLSVDVFAIVLVVPAAVETLWNGRSPGKALMGVRVVTTDGGPIAFRHAIVRSLLQIIELPTGIAMLAALGNRRSQRVGDLLAGTFVIRVRNDGNTAGAIAFYPPAGCEQFVTMLDVSRLSSQQFALIRRLLLRVDQLNATSRYDLAVRLAVPINERVTPAPPPQMGPELYLVCVASAFQIRNGGLPARSVAPLTYVPSGEWLFGGDQPTS